MQEQDLDALVASSAENVTYASDYWSLAQWVRRSTQAYVVLARGRPQDAALVVPTSNVDLLTTEPTWIPDIRRYGSFIFDGIPEGDPGADFPAEHAALARWLTETDKDALSCIIRVLKDKGLSDVRIGIDEGGIAPPVLDGLRAALPRARIRYAAKTFAWVRMVKTMQEIARLRDAARCTERAVDECLAGVRESVSERDLAEAFICSLVRQGALPANVAIGCGPRSAFPNAQPTDYRVKPGEIIRFDVGCYYEHYRADIARCAVLGAPPDRVRRTYHALLVGEQTGIAAIRPGVKASDVFHVAMNATRTAGLEHYRRSHVGHGIGIDGYDPPNLAPEEHTPLEQGMVFCVETPYYEMGWGGLQVEDTVLVSADGVQTLMLSSAELRVLS